jgi:hypothetical protein
MASDDKAGGERQYYDVDGALCTLDMLCRREPAWAANRIHHMTEKLESLRAELEAARKELAGAKAMLEGVHKFLRISLSEGQLRALGLLTGNPQARTGETGGDDGAER